MFCCESGTHVVDPEQSYYAGISYRAGTDFFNSTQPYDKVERGPEAPCLDSTQAWFCRDLWVAKAREGIKDIDAELEGAEPVATKIKRDVEPRAPAGEDANEDVSPRQAEHAPVDADANAGSDYDASDLPLADPPPADDPRLSIPNGVFLPARIMVNPRCVTTYAGVSHTQLALDLFGPPDREDRNEGGGGKDVLEDWEGAPETFVCQEQLYVSRRSYTCILLIDGTIFAGQLVDDEQRKTKGD